MRDPVSHDQLDDPVLAAAHSSGPDHAAFAQRVRGWAEDPNPLDEPGRGSLLTQAGEQLQRAGDQEAATYEYMGRLCEEPGGARARAGLEQPGDLAGR